MGKLIFVFILLELITLSTNLSAAELIHHDLVVSCDPVRQHIGVSDTISVPMDVPSLKEQEELGTMPHKSFRALFPKRRHAFTIESDRTIYDVKELATMEIGKFASSALPAERQSVFSKERMLDTVKFLASKELKGRGLGTPELNRAAEYIVK